MKQEYSVLRIVARTFIRLIVLICAMCGNIAYAHRAEGCAWSPIPMKRNVHIELIYDSRGASTGALGYNPPLPYTFFMLPDLFGSDERKVGTEQYSQNVASVDFELDRPLYDELIRGSNIRIPFYVEPGDTLRIFLNKAGRPDRYVRGDGSKVRYERLLRHDISNRDFYTAQDFQIDRENVLFPQFVERVMAKMAVALDSVNGNAERYAFTDEERRIAVNNAKMQFALWLFEFAPFKAGEVYNYSTNHKSGWQPSEVLDKTMSAIEDVGNYAFLREMPLTDSTCMASKYFPRFMMSYEHSHVLNCDQFLYYGTKLQDSLRMDSALISKEMRLTGMATPSLFMDVALQRRHYVEPLILNDGSIKLHEVKVMGQRNRTYTKPITTEEMVQWRLNHRTSNTLLSPSYWFGGRKKEKNLERAKALIKKLDEEEQREREEREAVMKAYEEEMSK